MNETNLETETTEPTVLPLVGQLWIHPHYRYLTRVISQNGIFVEHKRVEGSGKTELFWYPEGPAKVELWRTVHFVDAFELEPDEPTVSPPDPEGFEEFWKGYLHGLAFTASDESDSDGNGGVPVEQWSNPGGDIREVVDTEEVETALRSCGQYDELRSDCVAFLTDALSFLDPDEVDLNDVGSDFHLTRNGHGAGFWDGDWPEHGDALTELARPYGSAELMTNGKDWMVIQ